MIVTNASQIPQLRDQLVTDQIKLEKQVQRPIKTLLSNINRDATALYISTRRIANTNNYESDMTTILRGHYRKVIDEFGTGIRDQFNIPVVKQFNPIEEKKDINSDFNLASTGFINNHSEDQAVIIMNTQQDVLERNTNKALAAVAILLAFNISKDQGQFVTAQVNSIKLLPQDIQTSQLQILIDQNPASQAIKNREFAKQMLIASNNSAPGRAGVIATTETNDSLNFATTTEAEAIAAPQNRDEAIAAGIAVALLQKQWVTVRDNKVRSTHVRADRQRVRLGTPFTVGGFRLQRPSDSSLGAPAKETARCRCKAITIIGQAVAGGLGAEALF